MVCPETEMKFPKLADGDVEVLMQDVVAPASKYKNRDVIRC